MVFVACIAFSIFASTLLSTSGLQIGSQVHAYEAESAPSRRASGGAAPRAGLTEEQGQATYWRYAPENFMSVKPRTEPHINSLQHQVVIKPGALLKISREQRGDDGVIYLQLAEDGGWLFDRKPGVGTMCVREAFMDTVAFLESKAAYLGNATSKTRDALHMPKTDTHEVRGVLHTSVMPARKAVEEKIGTARPTPAKIVAIPRPLENHSAEKAAADVVVEPARQRLGLFQEAAAEGSSAGAGRSDAGGGEMVAMKAVKAEAMKAEAMKAEAMKAEATKADAVKAEALKAEATKAEALDAARQSVDQEFNPLNVTAPQLIEAGLEIAMPSAFGLGQTNVNMTRTTMCKGRYRPILLRTGQYSCDLPPEKGTVRYYLHAFIKMICDLFNLSRLILSLLFIMIALVGTYALEVFYFRKYKGPQYEVIGTDMSEEHPKEASGQAFGADAKGNKSHESAEVSATPRKPLEPLAELAPIVRELSALAPGAAPARNRWGLRQFVFGFVPKPWHCRRRRSAA